MRGMLAGCFAAALAFGTLAGAAPTPARATIAAPADAIYAPGYAPGGLVQAVQYYGYPGYYGGPRFYGRPRFDGPGYYGYRRFYGGPRFYGRGPGYYGRHGYYR